jgi:hypothetical protein
VHSATCRDARAAVRVREHIKQKEHITDRTDIETIVDLIDLDEGRLR